MLVAEVIGTVVASHKAAGLAGVPLLVVQPLDQDLAPCGEPFVACDAMGVGPGERVFCVLGREATHALSEGFVPVDAAVVGIVDAVSAP